MTDPIDKRIAEIKERCEKATEGPWVADTVEYSTFVFTENISAMICEIRGFGADLPQMANKHFIAASRTDIPWLVEELSKTRAALSVAIRELKVCDLILRAAQRCVKGGAYLNEKAASNALTQIDEILKGKE